MCKSLTNYFPRNNDFLVTYFGKTQNFIAGTTVCPNNFLPALFKLFQQNPPALTESVP